MNIFLHIQEQKKPIPRTNRIKNISPNNIGLERQTVDLRKDEISGTNPLRTAHVLGHDACHGVPEQDDPFARLCFWRDKLTPPEALLNLQRPILEVEMLPLKCEPLRSWRRLGPTP
jgi:hypothetical protein